MLCNGCYIGLNIGSASACSFETGSKINGILSEMAILQFYLFGVAQYLFTAHILHLPHV